uniref:Uncharacterized protein n=1 Tax=Anopheles albimanus TaxID=7167 RepID=A0A182FXN7_ANOAL
MIVLVVIGTPTSAVHSSAGSVVKVRSPPSVPGSIGQ